MSRHVLHIIILLTFLGPAGCDPGPKTPRQALSQQLAARHEAGVESVRLYREGMAAYEKEDFQVARKTLEEATSADPHNAHAWMALGVVAWRQDDPFAAVTAFDRAARLEPSRFEPHYNIGSVLESVGRYPQAIEKYELAYRLAPGEVIVIENLARCCIRSRTHLDRVAELIDRALQIETRPQWRQWLERQKYEQSGTSSGGQK